MRPAQASNGGHGCPGGFPAGAGGPLDIRLVDLRESLGHLGHGLGPKRRVFGNHGPEQNFDRGGQAQLVDLGRIVLDLVLCGQQFHEDFAQRPDVAAKIERPVMNDVRVDRQQPFEGRTGPVHFGVEKTGKLVIDFDLEILAVPLEHEDVLQDQVRDEVPDLMQPFQNGGPPGKKA